MTRIRTVRFDETAKVCVVKTPSKVESKSLWYTKKELKRMRLDIKCTLKSLAISSGGTTSDEEKFQWRGLERIQSGTMCLALENQQAFVRGVLSMQELHKKLGLRDDKAFTLFVSAYNKEAVQRAANAGRQDYQDAIRIHNEIAVNA